MTSSFHSKIAPATVLAALEKLRAERPATFEKMETFIFRNPAGWVFNFNDLGALLPGSDNRTKMGNVGRALAFFTEFCPFFAEELGIRDEIDARKADKSDDWPGTCLAVFTWDSVCHFDENGKEVVTFVLRPEYAAAFYLLSAKPEPIAA